MFAVGGVIGELASAKRFLYGLAPDGGSVHQFDFSTMHWAQIGGPAYSIYAGADRLYATNPQSGDIWEYFQVEKRWLRIGGPGNMFAVASTTGALYGLSPDGSAVYRYTGVLDRWERIGGAAQTVYAGSNNLVFATNPQTHDLWYLEVDATLPPIPKPLDLVWSSVDPNGLPLNPKLGWQVRRPYGAADYYPDVGQELKPPQPWTNQITSTDTGFGCVDQAHVNWMPVTYDGYIKWCAHDASWPFGDDDYNFFLFTPDGAGASRRTDENNGGIQVEFDSDETIDHFHTSWWNQFHQAVDSGNPRMIDGKRTIVTALYGLDLQHQGQSELHPAYAMAMLVNDDPHDDRWAIFVRTWGDEGWCSGKCYWLPLPSAPNGWKVYKFRLPWRPGATGVTWDNSDFLGRTDWSMDVTPTVNDGVYVTFSFFQGTGDQAPRINGALHLHWAGAAAAYPVLNAAAAANVQHATGVKPYSASQQILGRQLEALSPDARASARAELAAITVVRPYLAAVSDNVRPAAGIQGNLAAVRPLGAGDLVVRIDQDAAKADRMRQVGEVLRRHGLQ
jgi:hypothetical protein